MSSTKQCPRGCGGTCQLRAKQCIRCQNNYGRSDAPAPVVSGAKPPEAQIAEDREKVRLRAELSDYKTKYTEAVKLLDQQEAEFAIFHSLERRAEHTITIAPKEPSGASEATPIIIASDWHCEELVTTAQTNGLNQSNLEICDAKITRFWRASLNLIRNHLNPGVAIYHVVVGLLGDFITNDIHEELVENVALGPMHAIVWVQERLVAGIEFLLNNSLYEYTFVCKVGNHSRTTKKTHFSQENRHSLEYYLYVNLATIFRNEPRVHFNIQDGYHTYLNIYDTTIRMHHGHAINYQGGIGGIFIPGYKAISQWDKARPADLDIFGHFHQSKDGGKFICNGSLIGYNAFAVTIKADYEPPRQTLLLIDKKRGRTCNWPILLN